MQQAASHQRRVDLVNSLLVAVGATSLEYPLVWIDETTGLQMQSGAHQLPRVRLNATAARHIADGLIRIAEATEAAKREHEQDWTLANYADDFARATEEYNPPPSSIIGAADRLAGQLLIAEVETGVVLRIDSWLSPIQTEA